MLNTSNKQGWLTLGMIEVDSKPSLVRLSSFEFNQLANKLTQQSLEKRECRVEGRRAPPSQPPILGEFAFRLDLNRFYLVVLQKSILLQHSQHTNRHVPTDRQHVNHERQDRGPHQLFTFLGWQACGVEFRDNVKAWGCVFSLFSWYVCDEVVTA